MYFFSRRFFPFFNTLFWGAFNDNVFRYALCIMITYQCSYSAETASGLTFLAVALLMLPYFPFSALAGEIADKFCQKKLFFCIKLAEVILMALTIVAFFFQSVPLLLVLLCFMGMKSAFYSPVKYSYIARNTPDELIRGNAYMNAGTNIAILLGQVIGIFLIQLNHGPVITGAGLLLFAIVGFCAAQKIPDRASADPGLKLNINIIRGTWNVLKILFSDTTILHCVIGLSLYWMTGALYISQLSGFVRNVLGGTEGTVILFTVLFSVGVALGSCVCSLCNRHFNIVKGICPALVIMGLFTLDLYFSAKQWSVPGGDGGLLTISDFLKEGIFYRMCADLAFLAVCGGFYSVILNSLLQITSKPQEIARVIAANNIVNSFFIVVGAVVAGALVSRCIVTIEGVFALIAVLNFLIAVYLFPLCRKAWFPLAKEKE